MSTVEKIGCGDVIIIRQEYRTLGPSDYTGVVYSRSPLVLFPITGHGGNAVVLPDAKYRIVGTVRVGLIGRIFNMIKSGYWIGRNMHR